MPSRWPVRRIRSYVLAAMALVLAGTTASYLSRRQPAVPAPPRPAPIAEEIGQQTQAFTLSKTIGQNTLYTVTAERVTNYEDTGQALLHNVSVVIYGKDGSRQDRITTAECYYDPAASSIWIPGEVQMQFSIPPPGDASAAESGIPITVLTSRLSFEQSNGVASTEAPVQFDFAQGRGTSQGASYDPERQILTLRSQARFELDGEQGPAAGIEPVQVAAGMIHFVRETGKAVLEDSVEISRGSQRVGAARGEISLDSRRRVRQALLVGSVVATEETPAMSLRASAASGTLLLGESGRIRAVQMNDNVSWSIEPRGSGPRRDGSAQRAEWSFRESDGELDRVRAERDVRMVFHPGAASARPAGTQVLTGGEAELILASGGRTVRDATVRSDPVLELVPADPRAERRTITGDTFRMAFDENGVMSRFSAHGGARVISEMPGTPSLRRETSSDELEALFDSRRAGGESLELLRQRGHFEYRDAQRQARSEEAVYQPVLGTVALTGNPAVWNSEGKLMAARIELTADTGDMKANGNVAATLLPKTSGGQPGAEPIHVVADRLEHRSSTGNSRFEGRARLWQGEGFLVEAASIDWNQSSGELQARGKVYSLFQQAASHRPNGNPSLGSGSAGARVLPNSAVVIESDALFYRKQQNLLRYEGAVRMRNGAGVLTASELEIFLQDRAEAPPSSEGVLDPGRIERMVAQQEVRISEKGRTGAGERVVYLPAVGEVRLYGRPASVTEAARGTVQGAELTYHLGDDRIQVQGSPGSPTETRWQVNR